MSHTIERVFAHEIADSRGNPTLAVTVVAGGVVGVFSVPSGASTGAHEAHELRDVDGHMSAALAHIEHTVAPALVGLDASNQKKIDDILLELDGTQDKSRLGGNTTLGVSIACAKAAGGDAVVAHLRTLADITPSREEPLLFMNMINGGKHAKSHLAFQEYQIIPQVERVSEALQVAEVFQRALFAKLEERVGSLAFGDEGGVALDEYDVTLPLQIMTEVAAQAGCTEQVSFGLDVAATSVYTNGSYAYAGALHTQEELLELFVSWQRTYKLFSIEDPFFEEDFTSFAGLRSQLLGVEIIGDDLTTTAVARLEQAIANQSISAIIIKPNQAGTLSETLRTMELARKNNIHCVVSHRSGETEDSFIADLSFAFGCYGLKAGALGPKERMAKYTRLQQLTNHN